MKTTAKSLVMKPMFRSRVEVDRKKEYKYNPPQDDYEDMDWKEYVEYRRSCFKQAEDFLKRAGIIVEAGVLADEYK